MRMILAVMALLLRHDDKVSSARWRSYFSFFRGVKSANGELFKDFTTKKKWKRTSQVVGVILLSCLIPSSLLLAQDVTDKVNSNAVPPPITKPSRDFIMIQFAYNNWLQKPDSVKTKTFGYAFNAYACYDFPIKKTHLSFAAGLGVDASVVDLNQLQIINTDTSSSVPIRFAPFSPDSTYKRVKFVTTFITAPFELRYFSNMKNRNKGFKAAIGLTVGALLGSDTKYVTAIDGTDVKFKTNTKRYVTPWNFATTARIGWGHFSLFASYNLTNVFKQDVAPPITPASAGICLTGL